MTGKSWMKKPGDLHDRRGIPIYPGDLLRSPHFKSRRRTYYLYHTAVFVDGAMRMIPTSELEPSLANRGGDCLMSQEICNNVEIMIGHGPDGIVDFWDRPKYKLA